MAAATTSTILNSQACFLASVLGIKFAPQIVIQLIPDNAKRPSDSLLNRVSTKKENPENDDSITTRSTAEGDDEIMDDDFSLGPPPPTATGFLSPTDSMRCHGSVVSLNQSLGDASPIDSRRIEARWRGKQFHEGKDCILGPKRTAPSPLTHVQRKTLSTQIPQTSDSLKQFKRLTKQPLRSRKSIWNVNGYTTECQSTNTGNAGGSSTGDGRARDSLHRVLNESISIVTEPTNA